MTLAAAFDKLWGSLENLLDAVRHLDLIADGPRVGSVPEPVGAFRNRTSDVQGWLQEAFASAADARQEIDSGRTTRVGRHLGKGHASFNRALPAFLLSREGPDEGGHPLREPIRQLNDLATPGSADANQWEQWLRAVERSLDECDQLLVEVGHALLDCWQELLEHSEASPRPDHMEEVPRG